MSRRWIACVCEFRGRKRDIWGALYTELFFYDEVTALAAGHRPCFECRRADAESFKSAFGGDDAQGMDRVIDAERRIGRQKRLHPMALDELPPGAMFVHKGAPFVVRDATIRQWSFSGYAPPQPRPRGLNIEAITPPSICAALANGYKPLTRW